MTEVRYNFLDPRDSRDIVEPYLGYDVFLRYLADNKTSIKALQFLINDALKKSSLEEKGKKFKLREHDRPPLPFAPNNIRIGVVDFLRLGIPNDIAMVSIKPADCYGGDLWMNVDFISQLLQNKGHAQHVIPEVQFLLLTIPQHISSLIARYDLSNDSNSTHLAHKKDFYTKNKPKLFSFRGEKFKDPKYKSSIIVRRVTRLDSRKKGLQDQLLKENLTASQY